jgi:YesN/AraC family two-component response regulator
MKVVIVDDEWYGLDITYRLLTQVREDFDLVAFFRDPAEALEKIPMLKPDLVILDIEMPCINGLEVYELLKQMDMRFMMVSAHSATDVRDWVWDTNVGILTKPFGKSDIASVLKTMEL